MYSWGCPLTVTRPLIHKAPMQFIELSNDEEPYATPFPLEKIAWKVVSESPLLDNTKAEDSEIEEKMEAKSKNQGSKLQESHDGE